MAHSPLTSPNTDLKSGRTATRRKSELRLLDSHNTVNLKFRNVLSPNRVDNAQASSPKRDQAIRFYLVHLTEWVKSLYAVRIFESLLSIRYGGWFQTSKKVDRHDLRAQLLQSRPKITTVVMQTQSCLLIQHFALYVVEPLALC
jgi:hypothetical protein